jgi:uncharacterized protein YxjI
MYNYLIRKKIFYFLSKKFHIYDHNGHLIGYCKQKAFRLKEDIRIYTNEEQNVELIHIQARNIIDFCGHYDVYDSQNRQFLGSWRRKGWSSLFRDKWEMLDCYGNVIGELSEYSMLLAFVRRFLCKLIPQKYYLNNNGVTHVTYAQHFNPFVFKLDVKLADNCEIPPYLVLAGGVLLSAIEGRQEC